MTLNQDEETQTAQFCFTFTDSVFLDPSIRKEIICLAPKSGWKLLRFELSLKYCTMKSEEIMYRIIFEHHPKKDQEEAFIKEWQKGSDLIQTYLGARGTKLFRNPTKPGFIYAMAEWESKELRNAAMEAIAKEHSDSAQILHSHEAYLESYETIGEFECIAESNPIAADADDDSHTSSS